jgi:GNAT superfamily N-acetyltransferase
VDATSACLPLRVVLVCGLSGGRDDGVVDELTIRPRRPSDLDACVEALRRTHAVDSYPLNWPADPRRWLAPPRLLRAWVAERPRGVIVGHVALQEVDQSVAELSRLFVTPAARRLSLGAGLLAQALSWAAEHRLRLTLTVVEQRRSVAVAFYEAQGWQHTHDSLADWTAPDGGTVTLRHYALPPTHQW